MCFLIFLHFSKKLTNYFHWYKLWCSNPICQITTLNSNLSKWIGHQFLSCYLLKIQFLHYHIHSVTLIFKCPINPWPHFNCYKNDYNEFCAVRHTDLMCAKKRALVSDWYSVWAATLRSEVVFRDKSLYRCTQGFIQMCQYDDRNTLKEQYYHNLYCNIVCLIHTRLCMNVRTQNGLMVLLYCVPLLLFCKYDLIT